jgi:hypothetical protein
MIYPSLTPVRWRNSPKHIEVSYFASNTHIVSMTHRTILKVNVVCLEVSVAKEWLKWSASWSGSNERRVERRRDGEHGRLGVVYAILDKHIVPYLDNIPGRGVAHRVEGRPRVKLSLFSNNLSVR